MKPAPLSDLHTIPRKQDQGNFPAGQICFPEGSIASAAGPAGRPVIPVQGVSTLKKSELVKKVAAEAGMSQADAARALNVIISAVSDCLVSGDSITIQGFGTFKISEHKERKGRNPSTGEAMTIPARKVPKFAPGKELSALVQEKQGK